MRSFLYGAVVGALLGSGAMSLAAKMIGENGPLFGWTVTKEGEEVCSDPEVDMSAKEIECD